MNNYIKYAAMIGTAIVVMYGLTYLNNFKFDHIFFSEARVYMALLMGAAMAIIMLLFMLRMYTRNWLNVGIIIGSGCLFALSLWLVRSQQTVDDISYMKAMIPHHSIAILTSNRAKISDPRVRELADKIIDAQVKEIAEMKLLINDIESTQ